MQRNTGSRQSQRTNSSFANSPSSIPRPDDTTELRKRQTKRDEGIRQKMEKDLAKKRPTAARQRSSRKVAPGTVSSLRPTPPMTVPTDMTVHEGEKEEEAGDVMLLIQNSCAIDGCKERRLCPGDIS